MAFQQLYGPNTKSTPGFRALDEAVAPIVQAPVPEPTTTSKTFSAVKDYAQKSADLVPSFGEKIIKVAKNPLQGLIDLGNFVSKPAKEGIIKTEEAVKSIGQNKGTANKVADAANILTGVASTAFSPITGAFETAQHVPGLKQAADVFNLPFLALGEAGSWSAGTVVDVLPISQESKDIIKFPIQEVGALAAQVFLAGKVTEKISQASKKGQEITPELAKSIVEQSKKELLAKPELFTDGKATPGFEPLKTPAERHAEYAKIQGYEPYKSPSELPTIQTGAVPRSELPSIQTEALKTKTLGDLTIEPIKQATPDLQFSMTKLAEAATNGDSTSAQATLKDIQTKVTELSTKVDNEVSGKAFQSRVFERLKAENPEVLTGDLKANEVKLKQDLVKAVDLVAKDKQTAFDIAMGAKSSPDVLSTSANITLAEKALQDGNHELYSRLIQKRSLDQTRRGQEISAERGSVTDNSTARYVKELIASRLDKVGSEYLGDLKSKVTRVSNRTKATNKIDAEVRALETKIKTKKLDTKTAMALLDKLTCV